MKKLLQAICRPVVASPEFKEELLKQLIQTVAGKAKGPTIPLWTRPKLWVSIAAVLILATIGYGIWLPLGAAPAITSPVTPTVSPPATTPAPPTVTPPVSPPVVPPAPPTVTPPVTPPPTLVSTGVLEIRVTDAPAKREVSAINVSLANIEVHKAGEDGWTMVIEEPKTFELLELEGMEEVLGGKKLEAGHYTQIRMSIEPVTANIDGELEPVEVKLPGGKLKAVVSFDINADKTTVITLDFDADKSLVFTGEGKVIFKPVVKFVVTHEDEIAQP